MKRTILITFLICLTCLTSKVWATDYYVYGGRGDDGNPGTPSQPWNTLALADDVVGPGDTVYVKGTFTATQYLNSTTDGSGSSWSSPVTYRLWGDNTINWNGCDVGLHLENKSYVIFNGFYGSERRFRIYDGGMGVYAQSTSDHLKFTGFIFNPSGETGNSNIVIAIKSDYVYVYDNEINGPASGAYRECVYIGENDTPNAADYVYVYDNTITQTYDDSGNTHMQCIDIKNSPAAHIYVYNNTITTDVPVGDGCIAVRGQARIYGNIINASDGRIFMTHQSYLSGAPTSNLYIYRNKITGGGGAGDYLFGVVGGDAQPNITHYFYNNIVKKIGADLINPDGSVGTWYFYHNTFHGGSQDFFQNNQTMTVYAKNNIFHTWGTYALEDGSSVTSTWDGNHYYKSGQGPDDNNFTWNGTVRSFNSIKNTANQEAHGTFGINSNLDLNGKLTTPLPVSVDASEEMSGWPDYNLDIDGNVRKGHWDVGASQHLDEAPPDDIPHEPPTGLKIQ